SLSLAALPIDLDVVARAPLEKSEVQISMLPEGATWKQRIPVFTGRIVGAVEGAEGQGVDLEIAERVFDDRSLLVDAKYLIRAEDWPNCDAGNIGKGMPRVFGAPGDLDTLTAGSPAIVVDPTVPRLIVA